MCGQDGPQQVQAHLLPGSSPAERGGGLCVAAPETIKTQHSTTRYILKRTCVHTKTYAGMFIASFLIIADKSINPSVHQLMNGQIKSGLFVQWNSIWQQKGMKYLYLQGSQGTDFGGGEGRRNCEQTIFSRE